VIFFIITCLKLSSSETVLLASTWPRAHLLLGAAKCGSKELQYIKCKLDSYYRNYFVNHPLAVLQEFCQLQCGVQPTIVTELHSNQVGHKLYICKILGPNQDWWVESSALRKDEAERRAADDALETLFGGLRNS
jgi:hypothetical protein